MNTAVFCGSSLPRNKEIVEAAAPVRGENAEMKQQLEQKQKTQTDNVRRKN